MGFSVAFEELVVLVPGELLSLTAYTYHSHVGIVLKHRHCSIQVKTSYMRLRNFLCFLCHLKK